jgi:hypothetical protein
LDTTAAGADEVEIDRRVNEGATDFMLRTGIKVQEGNPTLTADEGDYTLDTDILDIMDVYATSGSQDYRMERISVPELLEMRRGASAMVGPARYYATAGANLLMVYPTPTGADELTVYFVPRPVTLSVGSLRSITLRLRCTRCGGWGRCVTTRRRRRGHGTRRSTRRWCCAPGGRWR